MRLSPLVSRVLAPNPSPFTYTGTQSYVVGGGDVAVIDPGPADDAHMDALIAAVGGRKVRAIMCTHTHRDHSPAAGLLAEKVRAPIIGCAPLTLEDDGPRADAAFDAEYRPDELMSDTAAISGDGWTIEAVATPGHTSNHLCFALREEQALFTGDHVMGWSTSIVSPPDGDMTAFMASCARLAALRPSTLHAGHGAPVTDPQQRIGWLMDHRRNREAQIVDALGGGAETLIPLTRRIYGADTDPALMPAAARNVLAHLIDLTARDIVSATPRPGPEARFELWRR